MIIEDQSQVIAFLSRPEAYGRGAGTSAGERVETIETHISVLFLIEDRAYKLKRAVRFPYLDFSTCARRQQFCQRELAVNRRTAPTLYRRVVAVTREADGRLALDGTGPAVDWLVEMVRFNQDDLLLHRLERGTLDRKTIERLADAIASFHANAEARPFSGGSDGIARIIDNNAVAFAGLRPGMLPADGIAELTAACRKALAQCAVLLDDRRQGGQVRHGHGDLHLRNIVLVDGEPTLFDAIEFSDALADIDVLYDLAFLLMDLDYRGRRDLASLALNRYLDATGDSGGLKALPLFLALRAAIRSHVDAAAAEVVAHPGEAERLISGARRHLDLAISNLRPEAQRLVAIGGLSGSGKSRLASGLAPYLGPTPGARVVRTDATRKRLCGTPLTARLGQEAYSEEMAERTYRAVIEEARVALAAGYSVIVDGVFARPDERAAVATLAAKSSVPFDAFWLVAPQEELERRVTNRRGNISDATAEVVKMQAGYELGTIDWRELETRQSPEATLAQALTTLGLA